MEEEKKQGNKKVKIPANKSLSIDVDSVRSELDENDQIFDRAKSLEDTKQRFAVKVTRDDD